MIYFAKNKNELYHYDQLVNLISNQMSATNHPKTIEHVTKGLDNALSITNNGIFFLSCIDDELRGFAYGNICAGLESGANYFWLNEIYVADSYRGSGIATELLTYIEAWAKEEHLPYLACITSKSNQIAQQVYKKNGFDLTEAIWVDKTIN